VYEHDRKPTRSSLAHTRRQSQIFLQRFPCRLSSQTSRVLFHLLITIPFALLRPHHHQLPRSTPAAGLQAVHSAHHVGRGTKARRVGRER